MHAVHEHHGIVLFKTSFQPFADLCPYIFHHTADAGLGVMPTIDLVKDISYLLLRKTLGIKNSCQPVAFLLLIPQYGEYLRMKVAVSVAGNTELELPALPIDASRTVAVTLVTRVICQRLTAFRDHHALQHDLHQVM